MTKTSTNTQVETTTVTVPVPMQATYERIEYIAIKNEDYYVTVDGVYLGIVSNYPGEKFWTATRTGFTGNVDGNHRDREAATKALILAELEAHAKG